MTTTEGWFEGVDPHDESEAARRVREGSAELPEDWPTAAVNSGAVEDEAEYYECLQAATIAAAETEIDAHERADDQQLIHAVRAMDDCENAANELAERASEWASSRFDERGAGIEYAATIAARKPDTDTDRRVIALARRVTALRDEATAQRRFVERAAPSVAPNLSALAGPILAARLIALSGGLDSLAKSPSSTVQVLGAEDALFAHLQGGADPPKHGIIFTHEYVNGTRPEERGSAARALAGKLTIAARVDYYGDGLRPELQAQLDERIERIRERGGDS